MTILVAMVLLGAGTYALRIAGPWLRSRITFPPRAERLMESSSTVLLTALVATTALTEGHSPSGVARPAGVAVAGLLAWRRAPFPLVIVAAAVATASLRLLNVP
ncbi:AzlD domain-containing protein [Actinomadura barringtoniae]|uniref:AzlD domain-containing protein n=1 Tax=Actinomadura barringtoniae TaxID=1427535 RepID=A0A939PML5_9ACTN|nr:AzlD domain-containing protein [Actinomadura barringtoniae]MBO2455415.1 AzlD domain-containing protein [Actinomadura barringtoniae]